MFTFQGQVMCLAIAPLAFAAFAASEAFQARPLRERGRAWRWAAGAAAGVALFAFAVVFALRVPGQSVVDSRGLGPDWDCSVAPPSAQVCFKKPPAR